MQNPKHTVIKPSTHTATAGGDSFTAPTIPGAHHYSRDDQWIIAYGPAVNRRHPTLARCLNIKNSTWLIIAEQSVIYLIDPTGKGKTVEQSGQQWPIWRYDGDKPDPHPEAGPGARVSVAGDIVRFAGLVPDMANVPTNIVGDRNVTRSWPSLDCSIAGHNLRAIVEPGE